MDPIFSSQILLSGLIAGWIIFQTAIVAPIVFTKLEDAQKALVLRAIFPKLFKAITVAGVIFSCAEYLISDEHSTNSRRELHATIWIIV